MSRAVSFFYAVQFSKSGIGGESLVFGDWGSCRNSLRELLLTYQPLTTNYLPLYGEILVRGVSLSRSLKTKQIGMDDRPGI